MEQPGGSKTKVSDLNPVDNYLAASWEALGLGAPVVVALAQLSAYALVHPPQGEPELNDEAKAILCAARERGILEIKAVPIAFQSLQRILAVYVELDDERSIIFRDPENSQWTVRFLEGFRLLCRSGLVMHQLHAEFSLTAAGFDYAKRLNPKEFKSWLDRAVEGSLHG